MFFMHFIFQYLWFLMTNFSKNNALFSLYFPILWFLITSKKLFFFLQIELEQYPTGPHIASRMLYTVNSLYGYIVPAFSMFFFQGGVWSWISRNLENVVFVFKMKNGIWELELCSSMYTNWSSNNNNNMPGEIPQVGSGEGRVYADRGGRELFLKV